MNAIRNANWARQEFGEARLGNALRNRRVERLAAAVLRKPAGTVTGVLKGDADREGAFRLLRIKLSTTDRKPVKPAPRAIQQALQASTPFSSELAGAAG